MHWIRCDEWRMILCLHASLLLAVSFLSQLYHLQHLHVLDTIRLTEEATALAEATFLKKQMYYNMRMKVCKGNTSNIIKKANEMSGRRTQAQMQTHADRVTSARLISLVFLASPLSQLQAARVLHQLYSSRIASRVQAGAGRIVRARV